MNRKITGIFQILAAFIGLFWLLSVLFFGSVAIYIDYLRPLSLFLMTLAPILPKGGVVTAILAFGIWIWRFFQETAASIDLGIFDKVRTIAIVEAFCVVYLIFSIVNRNMKISKIQ